MTDTGYIYLKHGYTTDGIWTAMAQVRSGYNVANNLSVSIETNYSYNIHWFGIVGIFAIGDRKE